MESGDALHIDTRDGERNLTISPDDRLLRLSTLLRVKGIPLNTRWGERGLCRGCLVHVLQGNLQPRRHEEAPIGDPAASNPALQAEIVDLSLDPRFAQH